MAKGLREALICDVCGYIWLQARNSKAETLPDRCRNRECRSPRWNSNPQKACSYCGKALTGKQRLFCSRRCKELAKVSKQHGGEVWMTASGHHALCACVACLAAICQKETKKGWPKGVRKTESQNAKWRAGRRFGKGDMRVRGEASGRGVSDKGQEDRREALCAIAGYPTAISYR